METVSQEKTLEQKVTLLEHALSFYANPDHWTDEMDGWDDLPGSSIACADRGKRAKKVLREVRG